MAQMKWVEKKMVILAILGREDVSLFTMRKIRKVMYGGLGGLMGPLGSQMANLHPHGMDEVG